MTKQLEKRKILITGAARGLGRAIALACAREGADLVVCDLTLDSLAETVRLVGECGSSVHAMTWDVRDVSVISAKLDEASQALGGLDTVVNNAGVLFLPDSDPVDEWDFVIGVNLKAVFFICKAAIARFQKQGGGNIINLASDAGLRPAPDCYSISKTGVVGLTRGLGKRHAKEGIRINAIAPGPVTTHMMGCTDGTPKEAPNLPLGRFSLPEEVAAVAVMLASSLAAQLNGQIIVVNSGSA